MTWFEEMDINVIFNELSIEDTVALVEPQGLKGVSLAVSILGVPNRTYH